MALLWIDGFDHYGGVLSQLTLGGYSSYDGTFSNMTATARTGSHSYTASSLRKALGGTYTTLGVGFAVRSSLSNNSGFLYFADSALNTQISVNFGFSGEIEVRRGATLIATSAVGVVTPNVWAHFEMRLSIDDAAGSFEVRINEATVLTGTGLDTKATAVAGCDHLYFGTNGNVLIDDLFIWDTTGAVNNNFIGDRRVYTVYPDADTATENWALSTGANSWALVDEASANDDTDYLSAATAGLATVLDLPSLAAGTTVVNGVQTVMKAKKTDAGACSVAAGVVSGGTASGTGKTLSTSYSYHHQLFNTDPNTAAAWTVAAANAVQLKLERTA